jgi:hypothetical protein
MAQPNLTIRQIFHEGGDRLPPLDRASCSVAAPRPPAAPRCAPPPPNAYKYRRAAVGRTLTLFSPSLLQKFFPDETLAARPITVAVVWSNPEPRRGHHRHRRALLAPPARGIELGHSRASPTSPSSPTPGAMNSGDAEHLRPRLQARCNPGELLSLLACSPDSIASRSTATPCLCLRHRGTSPPVTLR